MNQRIQQGPNYGGGRDQHHHHHRRPNRHDYNHGNRYPRLPLVVPRPARLSDLPDGGLAYTARHRSQFPYGGLGYFNKNPAEWNRLTATNPRAARSYLRRWENAGFISRDGYDDNYYRGRVNPYRGRSYGGDVELNLGGFNLRLNLDDILGGSRRHHHHPRDHRPPRPHYPRW